jgi:hypothetical protein
MADARLLRPTAGQGVSLDSPDADTAVSILDGGTSNTRSARAVDKKTLRRYK